MVYIPLNRILIHKPEFLKVSNLMHSLYKSYCCPLSINTNYILVSKKYLSSVKSNSDTLNQVQMMTKEIKEWKNDPSLNGVEHLRNTVLIKGDHITEKNFDAMFLTLCANEKAFKLGREYFHSIYSRGNDTIGVIGKFFRLCYDCKQECSEDEKSFMLELYKILLQRYEILDSKTCENVALGLSITSDWKDCLQLIEMSRFTSVPSSKIYSAVVQASFMNGELSLAFKLLQEMLKDNHQPSPEVYLCWLQAFDFSKDAFTDIFKFFEKYDIQPSEELVRILLRYSDKFKVSGKLPELTTATPSGKCRACYEHLNTLHLSENEFRKLKDAFLNPVLIGQDIFLKTKPQEFKSFINFLNKIENVDFVLDGLNIAFSPTHRNINVGLSAQVLCDVVKHFVSMSKKVLVLGRKHMESWPRAKMNYIKENAFMFLLENVSTDDPFILYATMYFGLGTYFVSRDQMRAHKFLLKDPDLMFIFSKWQQKHQYYFLFASKNGIVSLKEPVPYLQRAQQTRKGIWHIPISTDMTGVPAHLIPVKRKWLCLHE